MRVVERKVIPAGENQYVVEETYDNGEHWTCVHYEPLDGPISRYPPIKNGKVQPFDITEEALANLAKRKFKEEADKEKPYAFVIGNNSPKFMKKFSECIKKLIKEKL